MLVNEDCFNVLKNMEPLSVKMTLTDIPYGEVNQKSSGLRKLDREKADECLFDLDKLAIELARVTEETIYVFCGTEQISTLVCAFKSLKMTTRLGAWEKSNPSPMNGSRLWVSGLEFCVFARKPKATFNEHCQKALWKNPVGRSKIHPTEKPVALMERLIKASSNEGDLVFDPFMGSGTTGVAAKNLKRNFLGIEKDPSYFNIAQERIQSLDR